MTESKQLSLFPEPPKESLASQPDSFETRLRLFIIETLRSEFREADPDLSWSYVLSPLVDRKIEVVVTAYTQKGNVVHDDTLELSDGLDIEEAVSDLAIWLREAVLGSIKDRGWENEYGLYGREERNYASDAESRRALGWESKTTSVRPSS